MIPYQFVHDCDALRLRIRLRSEHPDDPDTTTPWFGAILQIASEATTKNMSQQKQAFAPGRDGHGPFQQPATPAEQAVLVQSRETGDVLPDDTPRGQVKALPFAKSWVHFMAGG